MTEKWKQLVSRPASRSGAVGGPRWRGFSCWIHRRWLQGAWSAGKYGHIRSRGGGEAPPSGSFARAAQGVVG